MQHIATSVRTKVVAFGLALLLTASFASSVWSSHGTYSAYWTGNWSSALDEYGDPVKWTQSTYNYHAHNSSASVQLNETSQWVTLDYTSQSYEPFAFVQIIEDGPGTWYYYDEYHLFMYSSQSENWRSPYYGMWVNKNGGAAYSRTTSYNGEPGVPWQVYHSVEWRDTYVCHYASGNNGSVYTC